jgi:hypothetical protein
MHVEEEGFRALTRVVLCKRRAWRIWQGCTGLRGLAVRSPAVPVLRVIAARHIEREVERDLVGLNAEGGAAPGRRDRGAPEPRAWKPGSERTVIQDPKRSDRTNSGSSPAAARGS